MKWFSESSPLRDPAGERGEIEDRITSPCLTGRHICHTYSVSHVMSMDTRRLITALPDGYWCPSHFTEKETEVKRVTCLRGTQLRSSKARTWIQSPGFRTPRCERHSPVSSQGRKVGGKILIIPTGSHSQGQSLNRRAPALSSRTLHGEHREQYHVLPSWGNLYFKFIYFEAGRGRERESQAGSAPANTGLELAKRELVTRAEIKRWTPNH